MLSSFLNHSFLNWQPLSTLHWWVSWTKLELMLWRITCCNPGPHPGCSFCPSFSCPALSESNSRCLQVGSKAWLCAFNSAWSCRRPQQSSAGHFLVGCTCAPQRHTQDLLPTHHAHTHARTRIPPLLPQLSTCSIINTLPGKKKC